jgi:hypothetical protein
LLLPRYLQQILSACYHDASKIEAAFRSGEGVGWHEHHHDLFHGTERFFRPNYNARLVSSWIPALDSVEEKLTKGAKVRQLTRRRASVTTQELIEGLIQFCGVGATTTSGLTSDSSSTNLTAGSCAESGRTGSGDGIVRGPGCSYPWPSYTASMGLCSLFD